MGAEGDVYFDPNYVSPQDKQQILDSQLANYANQISTYSMWLNVAVAGFVVSSFFLGPQMLIPATACMTMSTAFDVAATLTFAADAIITGSTSSQIGAATSFISVGLGTIPGAKLYKGIMGTTTAKMGRYGLNFASEATGRYSSKNAGAIMRTSVAPSFIAGYGYGTGLIIGATE